MRKKSKYGMPPPANRLEFEHNVFLTVEIAKRKIKSNQLDAGFVQITLPRLQNLKYTPNRRMNLNTVDEQLRTESNLMHWMELMPPPSMKQEDS